MFFPNNEHREAAAASWTICIPRGTPPTSIRPTVMPELSLPLRVGVAFVPNHANHTAWNSASVEDERFTEKQKMELMKSVSDKALKNIPSSNRFN